MRKVQKSLRRWFIIHFITDFIFGMPLLFTPNYFLSFFGYQIEPLTTRLVGAALIGMGWKSFLIRNNSLEQFQALPTLKIIWSLSAIVGIILTLTEHILKFTYIILLIFALFSTIWIDHKIKLNNIYKFYVINNTTKPLNI